MLNVDVVEGKELDHAKEFVAVCGRPSTATTLRLVAPYKGKGKTVIADSWFGSCRTGMPAAFIASFVLRMGTQGSVKTN